MKKHVYTVNSFDSIPFGPVPSRRLGMSLGINNIPPKICSYSCIYCQVGKTLNFLSERKNFYKPEDIYRAVQDKVQRLREEGKKIDYLSFVPDGEPTLDVNLGREIELLKDIGIPIAVLTNGSLVFMEGVRKDLSKADWVSLKVDAVTEEIWRRIDRPHKSLNLQKILEGMRDFASTYDGFLATETMLIKEVNDSTEEIERIVTFIARLSPDVAYIGIPTRPPSVDYAIAAEEDRINSAFDIFGDNLNRVELLIGYSGNKFTASGDVKKDILNITSVHPMTEKDIGDILEKSDEDWSIIEEMLEDGELIKTVHNRRKFYLRKIKERSTDE